MRISAEQLSTYVVCPEAWRLKYLENKTEKIDEEGAEVKKQWLKNQELSSQLRKYAKLIYFLLLTLTIVVFLLDHKKFTLIKNNGQIPFEIASLLLILGLLIFMWDFFDRRVRKINLTQGFSEQVKVINIKGSKQVKSDLLHNEELESRPDALIIENKKTIPVNINPTTLKLRDRHKIRMYLHFKLMQIKNETPPYGIIIIGENKTQHKIKNEPSKQIWLDSIISEIESIKTGIPTMATPSKGKCSNCDVSSHCSFSKA